MSLTLVVGSLLLSTPVSEDLPPLDRESEAVHLDFTASAWFPRLIGTYSFGPDGTELDVETETDLHDSELSFSGALDIRFDAWTIRILGSDSRPRETVFSIRVRQSQAFNLLPVPIGRATTDSGQSPPRSISRSGVLSPTNHFPGASRARTPPTEMPRADTCLISD